MNSKHLLKRRGKHKASKYTPTTGKSDSTQQSNVFYEFCQKHFLKALYFK
jgi:hypothetical protein